MLGKFITHCEDSLTASVIGHLLHLPIELFWQLLTEASIGNELTSFCGEPETIEFWPKWDPKGIESHTNYVEPDVLIRFKDFDLIIEAKRWDGQMQYKDQWQRELISYHNEYASDKKEVKFLALGGIGKLVNENISIDNNKGKFSVIKCTWYSLLQKIKELLYELTEKNFYQSNLTAQQRILEDVITLFASHGFVTGKWFKDFCFSRNSLHSPEQSIETFQIIRSNYNV